MVLTFPDYSQARFNALVVLLKQKGLTLSGNDSDVKRDGANVEYDETNGVLTLTVVSAPFWHNMDTFCATLTELANSIPER